MSGKAPQTTTEPTTVERPDPFRALLIKMTGMATLDQSAKSFDTSNITRILEAGTEDEMWDADDLARYNAQKLSGCHLELYGFEVKYSPGNDEEIKTPFVDEKGRQMYLFVHAARIDNARGEDKTIMLPDVGVEFVWNTSASNIVGKLFWMQDHGWFDNGAKPVRVRIQGTPLSGGRSVEKLKPLDAATVASTAEDNEPPF